MAKLLLKWSHKAKWEVLCEGDYDHCWRELERRLVSLRTPSNKLLKQTWKKDGYIFNQCTIIVKEDY